MASLSFKRGVGDEFKKSKKMLTNKIIITERLNINVRQFRTAGTPVIFIHGNASSSVFWDETMKALPDGFWGIAPDLRGYGDTEDKLIDATKGFGDWVEDLQALTAVLGIEKYHIIGHSLGGAFVFSMIAAESERVLSATLVNPGSPFGFGGTKDEKGTLCFEDFAGSGGGIVNPEFARLMGEKDRSTDNPQASPRVVMNSFYWKPPFVPTNEDDLLTSLLSQKVGANRYPGDFEPSTNYPFVKPGKYGPLNAASPKYIGDTINHFINANSKPSILWVRGAEDQIVSDNSLFDFGTLGKMGLIPNYPGEAVVPSQPMVSQTRYVLEQYQSNGGTYEEVIMDNTAHSPYIEKPTEFNTLFHKQLSK